ncbi:MAG: cell division protein FtsZ, partial [Dehalococcoidia bacterium]|nr:cell division protein FtsZ [Dehalococcoidia bacterium]
MAKQILTPNPAKIKVVGCGGGGCNAITRMVRDGIDGVEFIAINADAQALAATEANYKLQIGERATRGLGVGGDHTLGRRAAEETQDQIREIVSGSDMVFVAVGMGGGTGTGAAHVIARAAKELNILTVGVVTLPFLYEGPSRMRRANQG